MPLQFGIGRAERVDYGDRCQELTNKGWELIGIPEKIKPGLFMVTCGDGSLYRGTDSSTRNLPSNAAIRVPNTYYPCPFIYVPKEGEWLGLSHYAAGSYVPVWGYE